VFRELPLIRPIVSTFPTLPGLYSKDSAPITEAYFHIPGTQLTARQPANIGSVCGR
jgi:hypothetical protein